MSPEQLAAKRATAEMIKGVGGLEAAAGFCRVGKSVLHEAQSVNASGRFLAIDVVADLEPLAREREGWPHVTTWLCKQMGGAFVALPDGGPVEGDLLRCFAKMAKEYGDSSNALLTAAADGRVTVAECAVAERELDQLIAAAVSVREHIRAICAAGGQ